MALMLILLGVRAMLKPLRGWKLHIIVPPVPAFYNHPQNLDDMINHVTMRILDQFDIHLDVMNRWDGTMLTTADISAREQR